MTNPQPEPSLSRDQGRRRPGTSVFVLAGLVALEGIALIGMGLWQTIGAIAGEHAMPFGAILIMALLYLGYGLWLLGAARSTILGRLWPRALILLTQVFAVVIAVQGAGGWGWAVSIIPVIYAAVVILLLFSGPVQKHLLASNDLPQR